MYTVPVHVYVGSTGVTGGLQPVVYGNQKVGTGEDGGSNE